MPGTFGFASGELKMSVGVDYDGSNMLFVAGCPRSGTTWLQQLLACHPNIRTGRETSIFDGYIAPVRSAWRRSAAGNPQAWGHGLAGYFTEAEFETVLKSFLTSLLAPLLASLEPNTFFLEKTPANALHIREITHLLPACRIIHVIRDPRDVVASLLAASRSWGRRWAPQKARAAIEMWKRHVEAVRQASAGLPPPQFLEVRYEALHADPSRVLRDCAAFLGLEWDDEVLARAIAANRPTGGELPNAGTGLTVGGELQQRFGSTVHPPAGFVRKAQVGSWKKDLSLVDKLWVWALARKMMADNDYPWTASPKGSGKQTATT